jgi:hypothetical protein
VDVGEGFVGGGDSGFAIDELTILRIQRLVVFAALRKLAVFALKPMRSAGRGSVGGLRQFYGGRRSRLLAGKRQQAARSPRGGRI